MKALLPVIILVFRIVFYLSIYLKTAFSRKTIINFLLFTSIISSYKYGLFE